MKLIFILVIFVLLQHCSFDKKSGIWKEVDQVANNKENKILEGFIDLNSEKKIFNEIIQSKQKISLYSNPKILKNLNDHSLNEINTLNLSYKELNKEIFRSKKISKNIINKKIFFNNDNLIFTDKKGNIVIYSIEEKKIFRKFNFYKKTHKSINKKLNLVIKDEVIYTSDNIGYIYAYNYRENIILWAHRHKTPYRSNLKIHKKTIIASDQNNNLFFLDIKTGEELKKIPTEQINFSNNFTNNIIIDEEKIFFLNSYGSLYSFDEKMNINWFVNLNQKIKESPSNIFFSNEILIFKKNIFILTNNNLYVLDKFNGSVSIKKNFGSKLSPLIFKDYIFLINDGKLIVGFSIKEKKVIYSYNLIDKFKTNAKLKKTSYNIKNMNIVNNSIYLFLNKPYILKINFNGDLEKVFKIKNNINSNPIFINDFIYYLDDKNKLVILN